MDGGMIRAAIDLSVYGDKFGVRSEILGLGVPNLPDCHLPSSAIHSLPLSHPFEYRYSTQLKPWLDKRISHYDGIVLHGLWLYPNWATSRVCVAKRKKYVCFPHGMLDPWPINGQGKVKRWKKQLYWYARERKVLEGTASILFTTQRERQLATATFRLQSTHKVVTPCGLDQIPREPAHPRQLSIKLSKTSKIALFLGRIHPKKNVHFLIRCWLQASPPSDWALIIAGPGEPEYLAQLKGMVDSAHCKNVYFVGPVLGDDKVYLLQRAAWFLLPSKQENFGIAVLEAIGNGCPVAISSEVYLADELHPQSEILPLNQDLWIEFMRTRMQDENWRTIVRQKDRELIIPKFSVNNVAQAWVTTLKETFGPPV